MCIRDSRRTVQTSTTNKPRKRVGLQKKYCIFNLNGNKREHDETFCKKSIKKVIGLLREAGRWRFGRNVKVAQFMDNDDILPFINPYMVGSRSITIRLKKRSRVLPFRESK